MEKKIIEIVAKNPRNDYNGLSFSSWSLRVLARIHYKGDKYG